MSTTTNHAPRIIDCFAKLVDVYATRNAFADSKTKRVSDFKIRALTKICDDLRNTFGDDNPLTDVDQLRQPDDPKKWRKGYGKSSIARIQEILATGTLAELNAPAEQASPPWVTDARDLQTLSGIGPKKAETLAKAGVTKTQLVQWVAEEDTSALATHKITHHQRLGIKYADDLSHRIPHAAIVPFDTYLQTLVGRAQSPRSPKSLKPRRKQTSPRTPVPTSPSVITICGSFRRRAPDSGDVDVLVTHDRWTTAKHAKAGLRALLDRLQADAWLTSDHLTAPDKVNTKYMGFVRLPNHPWMARIDVRAVPRAQHACALAYFTGSKHECTRLRAIALKQGRTLNEYKLTDVASGKAVRVRSEEELYEQLGQAYVVPDKRVGGGK